MFVCDPRGQWPSKVDHNVKGDVKLQRKKSETANATMNEFLGSMRSFDVLRMTTNRMAFRKDPHMTMGR
jgi:hypothetical protein